MRGERLEMSSAERTRKSVLDQVSQGLLTLVEASERLGLSYRQCKPKIASDGDSVENVLASNPVHNMCANGALYPSPRLR